MNAAAALRPKRGPVPLRIVLVKHANGAPSVTPGTMRGGGLFRIPPSMYPPGIPRRSGLAFSSIHVPHGHFDAVERCRCYTRVGISAESIWSIRSREPVRRTRRWRTSSKHDRESFPAAATHWRASRHPVNIANAEGKPELQAFWREFKQREHESVGRMKELLAAELQEECRPC